MWKAASTLALCATALALLAASAPSLDVAGLAASAFVLALFWQQSGWLAHDFCHHQVFANRRLNDGAAYFLGNVCQGFSVGWWKAKHNQVQRREERGQGGAGGLG